MEIDSADQDQVEMTYLDFFDLVIDCRNNSDEHHARKPKKQKSAKENHFKRSPFGCFLGVFPSSTSLAHGSRVIPTGSSCWIPGEHLTPEQQRAFNTQAPKYMNTGPTKGNCKLGSCLRCRIRQKGCFDTNPCVECNRAADKGSGVVSLTWMLCVRPSFEDVNICRLAPSVPGRTIDNITRAFARDPIQLYFHKPFDRRLLDFGDTFVRLIKIGTQHSGNNIFSSQDNASSYNKLTRQDNIRMLTAGILALDGRMEPGLERMTKTFLRLSVHLFASAPLHERHMFTEPDFGNTREQCGYTIISEIQRQGQPKKLQKCDLQGLFVCLFMFIVGLRYRTADSTNLISLTAEASKKAALECLLCHYMIYVGKRIGVLRPTDDVKAMLAEGSFLSSLPYDSAWHLSGQAPDIDSVPKCTICTAEFRPDTIVASSRDATQHCWRCRKVVSPIRPATRWEEFNFSLLSLGRQFDTVEYNSNSMLMEPPPSLPDDICDSHQVSITRNSWLGTLLLRDDLSIRISWSHGTPYWASDAHGNVSLPGSDTYVSMISFSGELSGGETMVE